MDVTPAPRKMFFFLYALFVFSSIQNVRCYRTKDLSNEKYQEDDLALFRYKRNDNGDKANLSVPVQQPKADKLISNSALRDDDQRLGNINDGRPIFQAPKWTKPELMERQVFAKPLNAIVSKILLSQYLN